MKRFVIFLLILAAPVLVAAEDRVLETESSERSFEIQPGVSTRLVVDNVFGRIRVRGHGASRIELQLTKTIRGRNQDHLSRAQREVALEVTEERGLVDLYVNGPFRHPFRRDWADTWRDRGYRVVYDFDLLVPRSVELQLKTVEGGDLRVRDVRGDFEIANVNGGIEMSEIGGSGSAKTVNGPVRVEFVANPTGDSSFVTVNGDVEIFFRRELDADLELFSTFGELWTEFDVRPLASRPPVETRRNGKRVIRSDAGARVRAGAGGPKHSFETLNGDVLIRLAGIGTDLEESK